ncbi:uncharacterized protein LOC124313797 [Daphnia pulicaria]|uniref:uncharacterized protein LOC124313797 n=1 Tax=Daphnia pulicaria TaxID=35523 RepID=UPI001EEBF918|nr:uncharacterized protein LOC124313797 [Daphnia pulicaria]
MASFNRQRCHVAILFLLLSSAIGSPSGESLREINARKKLQFNNEAHITSTTTPAANPLDETTTETTNQNETSIFVSPTINTTLETLSDNPISETTQETQKSVNGEQQKQLNISHSGNNTRLPYQRNTSITNRPRSPTGTAPRESALERRLNVATSTPTTVNAKEAEESVTSEGNGTFRAEDLLTPLPGIAYFFAQLMSMSLQNLDTAFRGTVRNLSPVAQYAHSFRTTLLQISQKLNNAFLVSRTNADQIKMHSLFVPSKVKEAAGYLEKLGNSSRIIKFIYLPLKNLKETSDQTLNLSSQIAGKFGELVYLVDELSKIHTSSKSDKEEQLNFVSTEINLKNTEKNKIERDLTFIENEIENLKKQTRLDEKAFYDTIDALNHLKEDKSQCYWYWLTRSTYCPPPDPKQIQKINQSQRIAKGKLENTMKSLHAKEEEAREKREERNQLLITTESLRHEMNQLNEDLQLLGKTSDPLNRIRNNNTLNELDKSWKKFVDICRGIQSGAKKNLEIIEDANRTSTHWSQQHSEKISFNLNKIKEDLHFVKTVIEFYLEGSSENIVEIFAEVEQMMTKRENPEELERSLREQCNKATEEIKTLTERNKGPTQTQTPKPIQKGKDSRSEKHV